MRATPPTGLPVLRPLSSFMHASANTPAGAASASIALFPAATGLPLFRAGSTPTLPVSRPARRSLTFRPACSLNRLSRSFCQSASIHVVTSMNRPDCYQPETIVAGRDSHPLERGAFHGARGSRARVLKVRPCWRCLLPLSVAYLGRLSLGLLSIHPYLGRSGRLCGARANAPECSADIPAGSRHASYRSRLGSPTRGARIRSPCRPPFRIDHPPPVHSARCRLLSEVTRPAQARPPITDHLLSTPNGVPRTLCASPEPAFVWG